MKRALAAVLVPLTMGAACTPITTPAPGDNVLRVEVHTFAINPSGTDVMEIRRTIKVRADVTNGADLPILGDDGKLMTNWRADASTPFPLVLSQPHNAPHPGLRVSMRIRVGELPGDDRINIVCNFIVNGVEDVKNVQAAPGPEAVCMYRTDFQ